jgi:amino acid transporter
MGDDGNTDHASDNLNKTLTLKDLVLFGVISIFGSGGFNLIGRAITQGGPQWPLALGGAAALFLGSSKTYEEAFREFKKNTSESDFLEKIFGPNASYATMASILLFNFFSIATILVLCVRMIVPDAPWLTQSVLAISLITFMGIFSLQGIAHNKVFVNFCSSALVIILSAITLLGFAGAAVATQNIKPLPTLPNTSLTQSFLYFFYILAGFDVLMKFSEETKDAEDIPRSFYVSNSIAILFVLGLTFAVITFTDLQKVKPLEHVIGQMLNNVIGYNVKNYFNVLAVFFMIVTMFVTFLATTRYMYSLGDKYKSEYFTALNKHKAPVVPVALTTLLISAIVLINHVDILVGFADVALGSFLFLVAAAATVYKYQKGEIPVLEGLTASSFLGVFGASVWKLL